MRAVSQFLFILSDPWAVNFLSSVTTVFVWSFFNKKNHVKWKTFISLQEVRIISDLRDIDVCIVLLASFSVGSH